MKRSVIGSCALLMVLTACNDSNVKPGDRDYPQKNPAPTRFMAIHGTADSALGIKFRVHWLAKESSCRYATSVWEGAYANYSAFDELDFERSASHIAMRVPIDGVLPGRCRWTFGGVSYAGSTGWYTSLVQTNSYPLQPGQSPNGVINLRCGWDSIGGERNLNCRDASSENRSTAVLGGVLWWHPETTDLEVNFIADGSH